MKLRKQKHWNRGYNIIVKVGDKEYCSWWSSPPKEKLICHLEYLRNRYPIINTEKRLETFKKLWVKMWEPKAKCIKDFVEEKCDDDGFVIPNKYFTVGEGEIWELDNDNTVLGGEIRLTRNTKRGYLWIEMSKEIFKEHFEEID